MVVFRVVCLFYTLFCVVNGQTFSFVNPREEVSNVTATSSTSTIPKTTSGVSGPTVAMTTTTSTSTTTTSRPTTTTTTSRPTTTTTRSTTTTTSGDFMTRLKTMASDSGARGTSKPVPKGNFDDLLDNFLGSLAISIRESGYDPLHLSTVGPCYNCTVEGISLVRRTGPSNLAYENNTLIVDAHVTMPILYTACQRCFIKIKGIPVGGKIEVSIWDLSIYAKVAQLFKEGAHPTLLDYKVINDGDVDVTVSGVGVVAPAIDIGFNTFGKKFVPLVFRHVLRNEVPKLISSQLKKINLPPGLF